MLARLLLCCAGKEESKQCNKGAEAVAQAGHGCVMLSKFCNQKQSTLSGECEAGPLLRSQKPNTLPHWAARKGGATLR
jgi:hypothetical protein